MPIGLYVSGSRQSGTSEPLGYAVEDLLLEHVSGSRSCCGQVRVRRPVAYGPRPQPAPACRSRCRPVRGPYGSKSPLGWRDRLSRARILPRRSDRR
jgi:hypothetical protein